MTKNTKTKNRKLANEIRDWLIDHEMWIDTRIYFDGVVYATSDGKKCYYNDREHLIEMEDDPARCMEYFNRETVTMSFEGPLYDLINYDDCSELFEEFGEIFRKYGYYYELGNAWNLACYEL
jgi:hypothetical protein